MSRNAAQQQDLQLLVEAINNKSEAEANGVKFIYMDDNTIYRFENNRMKKVSASLLKKASKLAAQDIQQVSINKSEEDNAEQEQTNVTPQKRSQRSKKVVQQVDEEYSEDEPEPVQTTRKRTSKRIPKVPTTDIPQVDLNEYWNVKNKNEFMQSELERLNNKVSKLRHYKNIVNRLTGAEYDADIVSNNIPQQQPLQQAPQQPLQNNYDNYFNNPSPHSQYSRTVNDSLFL